jgi:hypothetical protein
MGFGVLRRISQAVGARMLEKSYESVLARHEDSIAYRMVDLSIRLDHFASFPSSQVRKLWDDLKGNMYSCTLVRYLIWYRLYLFNDDYRVRQEFCAKLGIVMSPRLLDNRAKLQKLMSETAEKDTI